MDVITAYIMNLIDQEIVGLWIPKIKFVSKRLWMIVKICQLTQIAGVMVLLSTVSRIARWSYTLIGAYTWEPLNKYSACHLWKWNVSFQCRLQKTVHLHRSNVSVSRLKFKIQISLTQGIPKSPFIVKWCNIDYNRYFRLSPKKDWLKWFFWEWTHHYRTEQDL